MPMTAYCGLDCGECPAYKANLTDDQALREETASTWSKEFGATIAPDDVNCTGCHGTEGIKFAHCSECAMRLCALQRPVETCADCGEYPCDDLKQFFGLVPSAKETLDAIRAKA